MKKSVKFIPETQEWIVDGVIIKDINLSDKERKELEEACTGEQQIIGNESPEGELLNE